MIIEGRKIVMREDWDNKPLAIEVVEGCEPEIGRLLWQLEVTRERTKEQLLGAAPPHPARSGTSRPNHDHSHPGRTGAVRFGRD